MTALTAKLKPLTTHEAMCDQLKVIAAHLLDHFEGSLSDLANTNHKITENGDNPEAEETVAYLCKQWKAEVCEDGICKAFVFVNHQWVVKLGENAVDEAIAYTMLANEGYQHLVVPTIPLGDFGCLQVKATIPNDYVDENNLDFDEFWYHERLKERRYQFEDFCNDVHMDNCGFINDILYLLDFAGVSALTSNYNY